MADRVLIVSVRAVVEDRAVEEHVEIEWPPGEPVTRTSVRAANAMARALRRVMRNVRVMEETDG